MLASRKQTESLQSKIIRQIEAEPDTQMCNFSTFEDDLLRKYYKSKGANILAKYVGKLPRQVMDRANQLGLRRK